jgi:hypothetical protein
MTTIPSMPRIFNVALRDDLQQAPRFSSSISLRVPKVSGTREFIRPLIEGMRDKVHYVKGTGERAASPAADDSRKHYLPDTSIRNDMEDPMKSDSKKAERKSFGTPDEVRTFPKGKVELVKIGGAMVGRAIFEPGWKWSTSVQPLAKTKSCEAPHFQYHVSGVLRVVMDDGTQFDCKAGDVSLLPVGHDAWVVGNEPAVIVDFQGMLDYAKSK